MIRFGQNLLNGLRQRHSDVVKTLKIRTFILKKEDFLLNLGKKENLKNSKKELFIWKRKYIIKTKLKMFILKVQRKSLKIVLNST